MHKSCLKSICVNNSLYKILLSFRTYVKTTSNLFRFNCLHMWEHQPRAHNTTAWICRKLFAVLAVDFIIVFTAINVFAIKCIHLSFISLLLFGASNFPNNFSFTPSAFRLLLLGEKRLSQYQINCYGKMCIFFPYYESRWTQRMNNKLCFFVRITFQSIALSILNAAKIFIVNRLLYLRGRQQLRKIFTF